MKEKMSKKELLFVRACKSINSEKRVRSVYRRFYAYNGINEEVITESLIVLLGDIAKKYVDLDLVKMISELHPDSFANSHSPKPYNQRAVSFLIKSIRFCSTKNFPDYRAPAKFRN